MFGSGDALDGQSDAEGVYGVYEVKSAGSTDYALLSLLPF